MIASLKFQQFHQVPSERAARFKRKPSGMRKQAHVYHDKSESKRITSNMSRQGQRHV